MIIDQLWVSGGFWERYFEWVEVLGLLRRLIKLRELLLQKWTERCLIVKGRKELVTYTWTSEAQTTSNWTVPSVIYREGLTQTRGLMVGFIFPWVGNYWYRWLQIKPYWNCCWFSNEMESIEVSDTESAWQVWHGMSFIAQTGTVLFTSVPCSLAGGLHTAAHTWRVFLFVCLFVCFWLPSVFVAARGFWPAGLLFVAVHGLLIAVAFLVAEHWL